MSKKLQDDGKTATTTLTPATYFPDILSKQVDLEAKGTSQTHSVGSHMQTLQSQIAVPV